MHCTSGNLKYLLSHSFHSPKFVRDLSFSLSLPTNRQSCRKTVWSLLDGGSVGCKRSDTHHDLRCFKQSLSWLGMTSDYNSAAAWPPQPRGDVYADAANRKIDPTHTLK